ncbi:MAG: DUF3137 domain-containing protein [Alphaproteobacteria bacterium]|nr:DUF3137 domain-containing protein [Alphaproteobacteria bacterium]
MNDLKQTPEFIEQKQKFDVFYEQKLKPVLAQNEMLRRRYLLSFLILILMALLFYPYLLYLIVAGEIETSYIGLVLCASCVVIIILCGPVYFYKKRVKPKIMPDFAGFFGNFTYLFEGKVDDAILRTSDLFGKYDISAGDDYFTGLYDGVHISIGEQKLKTIGKDFRGNKIEKDVFSGVCILFEMNKSFKGKTVVLKDRGTIGNALNKVRGLYTVRLEDSRFEKVFEVYSDDQVEARYLLTTAFMERMLKLRDLYDGKAIQFCFNNNTLLLSIPTRQDMFEASSFFRSNINKKKVDLVFEQFWTIFSVVRLLKLNQRLGM